MHIAEPTRIDLTSTRYGDKNASTIYLQIIQVFHLTVALRLKLKAQKHV